MLFKEIAGNTVVKQKLLDTVKSNRISHGLLFLGQEGCGKLSLAIAYAQFISCKNKHEDDACGTCSSCVKYNKLIHPDLHFVFPVAKNTKFTKPVSDDFIKEWREFVLSSKFHSYNKWLDFIGTENLQGSIYAQESQEILKKLNLKTFEAEYKIMIIWMAEKMNITAANKLLKILEEPPAKTLFILITEDEGEILTTIRSRTQLVKISRLSEEEIKTELKIKYPNTPEIVINDISRVSNGNMLDAEKIIKERLEQGENHTDNIYFEHFSKLMRYAYSAKVLELITWTEDVAGLGREKQKTFLEYCMRMVRENFVMNITQNSENNLVFLANQELDFSLKFNAFISKNNIIQLNQELNDAQQHIERNAYDRIVFLDLALKFVKLLKIK